MRELQQSRQEADLAKQALADRRREVFKQGRRRARHMTAQLQQRRQNQHHRAEVGKSKASIAVATASGAQVACPVVQRHDSDGADGHGTATEQLAAMDRARTAAQKAARAASEAHDREMAHARHRQALAEVQHAAAKPAVEAELHQLQQVRTQERLKVLSEHQYDAVASSCQENASCPPEPTFRQLAAAQAKQPNFTHARRVAVPAHADLVKVQLRANSSTADCTKQGMRQQTVHLRRRQPHSAGAQMPSVQTQWRPVEAVLPPAEANASPERAARAALGLHAASVRHAPRSKRAAASKQEHHDEDGLPPGFFAAGHEGAKHTQGHHDIATTTSHLAQSDVQTDKLRHSAYEKDFGHGTESTQLLEQMQQLQEEVELVRVC